MEVRTDTVSTITLHAGEYMEFHLYVVTRKKPLHQKRFEGPAEIRFTKTEETREIPTPTD